jgi:hypothetical protein
MVVDDIVIVGGGSAGWMTAAILIKSFPEKNITLIESETIEKIGVGESTYDGISYYFEYLEIDKKDFFVETDASIKLGIEFVDFYKKGEKFLYPFGIAYTGETEWGMLDWMVKKYCYPKTPNTEFAESYFPVAHMMNNNTFYENKENVIPNFDSRVHTALHFDAQKFANWLKNKYCIPRGVNHIVSEVSKIKLNDKKIKFLILKNNKKIKADLFVDCSGFKSLLLGKTLKEPFQSYENILPNNRAWATQIPYIDKRKELETSTRCTAIENGWVWNIPLYSRLGSGYVYSDKFISSENALQEFKKYLCSNKMKIARNLNDLQNLTFKDIKMRVGIHKRIWVENVVAIGLSAAFIEPLESNGLFSVHEFLFQLIRTLNNKNISSWDIHVFNEKNKNIFEGFIEFVKLHYALSMRDDTKYWENNLNSQYSFDRLTIQHFNNANLYNFFNQQTVTNDAYPNGGFLTGVACISTGMNHRILEDVSTRLGEIKNNLNYKKYMDKNFKKLDEKRYLWDSIAKSSPILLDYLEEKYYDKK